MSKAILGKKLGMTQFFKPDGTMVPVTVIEAGPCAVVQKKTVEHDGYEALKVGFIDAKEKSLNKPELGAFKKAGVKPKKFLKEIKFDGSGSYSVGDEVKCDVFKAGDIIDVTGITRGHGFTGNIKRWNARRLKETHGVGPVHREVGSMSAHTDPSRVFPGKLMPGHYGVEQATILNLDVVKVDTERNLILVHGSVPGPKNCLLHLRSAVKNVK